MSPIQNWNNCLKTIKEIVTEDHFDSNSLRCVTSQLLSQVYRACTVWWCLSEKILEQIICSWARLNNFLYYAENSYNS